MSTFCSKCGNDLELEVNFCSNCGTPTSSYYAHSCSSRSDPTIMSARAETVQPGLVTGPTSVLYSVAEQNPYINPYTLTPPPPPHPRKHIGIVAGALGGIVICILMLLSCVGVFALIAHSKHRSEAPAAVRTVVLSSEHHHRMTYDDFRDCMHSRLQWTTPQSEPNHTQPVLSRPSPCPQVTATSTKP